MWKPNFAPPPAAPALEKVPTPAAAPARPAAPSPLKAQPQAFIGRSICIKGEVTGSESLHVDGRVEGPIQLADSCLHIGQDATVISQVTAREVVVHGTLQGNSTLADRLEIRSGGSLIGNVTARRISIEDGAYFKGSIDMRRAEAKGNGSAPAEPESPAVVS